MILKDKIVISTRKWYLNLLIKYCQLSSIYSFAHYNNSFISAAKTKLPYLQLIIIISTNINIYFSKLCVLRPFLCTANKI